MVPGKVYLVGAGPGDPGLITVRGLELLSRADAVLYDALAHPALLDACPNAEKRNVGKRFGQDSAVQHEINAELIALARAGKRVVRLKGGDPLLFARGAEELQALRAANIEFEIVPGVSAPLAASAFSGIPLTHRELSSSVTFITGSDREGKDWSPASWQKLATATDTICIFMGMRRIEDIMQAIIAGGRSAETEVAVVQWAARPEQRVVRGTLDTIAARVRAEGITNPAVIIVGEVVALREQLRWFDNRPLFGKSLLVPRPAEQGRVTAAAIRARGANARLLPAIEIRDPADPAPLARAVLASGVPSRVLLARALVARDALPELLRQAGSQVEVVPVYETVAADAGVALRAHFEQGEIDVALFTSSSTVNAVADALGAQAAELLSRVTVASIGPITSQTLRERGVRADVVATSYTVDGLLDALETHFSSAH